MNDDLVALVTEFAWGVKLSRYQVGLMVDCCLDCQTNIPDWFLDDVLLFMPTPSHTPPVLDRKDVQPVGPWCPVLPLRHPRRQTEQTDVWLAVCVHQDRVPEEETAAEETALPHPGHAADEGVEDSARTVGGPDDRGHRAAGVHDVGGYKRDGGGVVVGGTAVEVDSSFRLLLASRLAFFWSRIFCLGHVMLAWAMA
tara:strand:+ start:758 stop:1348 length:591 start_codon:yes stop_codon:yes gene_type:complete